MKYMIRYVELKGAAHTDADEAWVSFRQACMKAGRRGW